MNINTQPETLQKGYGCIMVILLIASFIALLLNYGEASNELLDYATWILGIIILNAIVQVITEMCIEKYKSYKESRNKK